MVIITQPGSGLSYVLCYINYLIGFENTLCGSQGMTMDGTTLKICPSSPKACEVYFKQGKVNGIQVSSCSEYCAAHGLRCLHSYPANMGHDCSNAPSYHPYFTNDHSNRHTLKLQYTTCDTPADKKDSIGCVCSKFY